MRHSSMPDTLKLTDMPFRLFLILSHTHMHTHKDDATHRECSTVLQEVCVYMCVCKKERMHE